MTNKYGSHLGKPLAALMTVLLPCAFAHAEKSIDDKRDADPQGAVEIVTVAGTVSVEGWQRNEVQVSGTVGDGIERVDLTGSSGRTSIHVVPRSSHGWNSQGEAHLVIHVPSKSSVSASLVSADLKLKEISGSVKLQSVSGSLEADVQGDLQATTVSGDAHLNARSAKNIEVKAISGDIQLKGGGGDVSVTTISGTANVELAQVTHGHLKTVSGDLGASLSLSADGELEGESVSGSINVKFSTPPAAQFDVQSISGDIENCSGPKPVESRYGPGSRLQYTEGAGTARVRINTKSGDVGLCTKAAK